MALFGAPANSSPPGMKPKHTWLNVTHPLISFFSVLSSCDSFVFVFNSLPFTCPLSLSYHCNLHVYKTRFLCLAADSIGNFKQVGLWHRSSVGKPPDSSYSVCERVQEEKKEMVRCSRRRSPTHTHTHSPLRRDSRGIRSTLEQCSGGGGFR